jgi:hypothetical protein
VPDTLHAVGVFLLAVLPGAIYIWSFERVVGRWGIGLSDRVLRFTAASAAFLVLFLAPLYYLRAEYVHHRVVTATGEVRYENRLSDAGPLPWWLFVLPIAYLAIPAALGTAVGRAVRSPSEFWSAVGRVAAGRDPAPRGWDYLFSSEPAAAVRMKLKDDGPWLGGFFGESSHAAGYPEEPQDLFLERTFAMNQSDGSFLTDENDAPQELQTSLLVRWSEIQFLEVFPEEEAADE